MLVIRLTRKGKKNQPFFRVVVTDKRKSSKAGRALEDLGYVDPLTKRKNLKKERILYWISKGAQPSESIHNLLVAEKIIEGKKIHVSKLSTKKKAEISKAKEEAGAKAVADKKEAALPEGQASLAPEGAGSTPVESVPVVEEKPAESPAEPVVETPKEEPKAEEKTVEQVKTEKPKEEAKPEKK